MRSIRPARAADGAVGSTANPADEETIAESTRTRMVREIVAGRSSGGIMCAALVSGKYELAFASGTRRMCLRTAMKGGMGAFPGGCKWEWCEVVGEASPKEANGGQWLQRLSPTSTWHTFSCEQLKKHDRWMDHRTRLRCY